MTDGANDTDKILIDDKADCVSRSNFLPAVITA